MPINRPYPGKNDYWLFLRSLVFRKGFSKSEIKDFWRKLMPTFCRKPHVASFYSSLIQPYTKLCHRQKDRHTYEIKYMRFRQYVCIGFAIFLLRKKYIAPLNYLYITYYKYIYYIHLPHGDAAPWASRKPPGWIPGLPCISAPQTPAWETDTTRSWWGCPIGSPGRPEQSQQY